MKLKKYIIVTIVFFIMILFLSPISGDDWGNYMVGTQGLRHMIGQAIGMYFDWEGRLVSRIFINFLTYHKWLWNIMNSLLITSIIYFTVKIIEPKDKKTIYFLSLFGMIGMNIYMFSQSITWMAGNITYLFPLSLYIMYLYYLKTNQIKNHIVSFGILNFILPMFVEHMAVLLVLTNLLVNIILYIRTKKVDKILLCHFILSIFSTILMLLSPGSNLRTKIENIEFNQLSLIGKILYNIPNFMYYTFISNAYLMILWIIVMIYLIRKQFTNKIVKKIFIFYITGIPILTIIGYHTSILQISYLNFIIDSHHLLVILYWISFVSIFIFLMIKNIKNQENIYCLILFLIGISANGIMLLSPTWGYRTALATNILVLISLLWIISDIKIPGMMKRIIPILGGSLLFLYLILYSYLYYVNQEREQFIKQQIKSNQNIIQVKKLPIYAPCNSNPTNEYHEKVFKKYYGIEGNKKIQIIK